MSKDINYPVIRFEGTRPVKLLLFGLGFSLIIWFFSLMIIVGADGLAPAGRLVLFILSAAVLLGLSVFISMRFAKNIRYTIAEKNVHISEGNAFSRTERDVPLNQYSGIGLTEGPRTKTSGDTPASEYRVVLIHPDFPINRVILFHSIGRKRAEQRLADWTDFLRLPNLGDTGIFEDK